MDNIFRLHGTPKVTILDWDPRFTSWFWTQFFHILGMNLWLSTTFHPQADGQSKVTTHVLEKFLQPYVELNPHVWSRRLSLAKFAINNAINRSTAYIPFFLNSGENLTLWYEVGCCDGGDCVDFETSYLCFWDLTWFRTFWDILHFICHII